MARSADTIAALATPVGTSALAVVRASGPLAPSLARAIFCAAPPPRQTCHADYRDRAGALIDDVLYVPFQAPRSYTGEDVLEISCHGNPFIVRKILDDLYERGCRPAEPGEFTKRAFLNGCMDLSQAEAVADLIRARSERALAAANQQLRGALGRRMDNMNRQLLDLLAHVEAYIDFPDEDLPPDDRSALLAGIRLLLADTTQLLATDRYGEILRDGVKTVILGAPNSGKSSLLNRLLGRERALVSPEPGTTRDYLQERITLGPHCIRLTDTAGLNPSPTPLEKLGMAKALEHSADADLILLVLDATQPAPALPEELSIQLIPQRTLVVVNKIDLVPDGSHPRPPRDLPTVKISALTGAGCDELAATIIRHAESFRVEQGEDLITINARHANALRQAIESLETALAELTSGAQADELLASDLRNVLASYGEISGKIDNELVLDHIFETFCIGK
jgi:tRNA modification GTPase